MPETRYFAFDGRFTHEVDGEDVVITDKKELEEIIMHVLYALNVYEKDGFRFVDVDGGGKLSDGTFRFAWSDYGL